MLALKNDSDLEKIFDFCNEKFFQKKLHFKNFNKKLSSLSKEDFIICFFCELIHLENFQKKIKDVGRNSYHKKTFLEKAINIGFFVTKHKSRGWCLLSLHHPRNVVFENFCVCPDEADNQKLILFIQNLKFDIEFLKNPKKEYTFKYTCKCPSHNIIRSGRDPHGNNSLQAKCLICNSNFELSKKQ